MIGLQLNGRLLLRGEIALRWGRLNGYTKVIPFDRLDEFKNERKNERGPYGCDNDDDEEEWSGIDLQANGEEISFENSDDCPSDDSEAS